MNPALYKPTDFQWSQRDWRWAGKKIGISGLDIGHYGCATLAANYCINRAWMKLGIKRFSRPGEFIDFCNNNQGYTDNGMLFWTMVDKFTGGKLKYTPNKKGSFISVAQVRWGSYLHWIVLLDGDICMNPWTGKFEKRAQAIWEATGREIHFKLG